MKPVTARKVRGMEVSISDEERAAILAGTDEVLKTGWLMWGAQQEQFEKWWEAHTKRRHAVTHASASLALESLLRYLKRKGSYRVLCQANVFPAVPFAVERAGMEIVWCDIDVDLAVPTIRNLEDALKRRKFDVAVLQWTGGAIPAQAYELVQWCRSHGVYCIEDASHAAGSRAFGTGGAAGSIGDSAILSLAATKSLHTGLGGMLLTDDDELDTYAFRMKVYGRTEMFQKGEWAEIGTNAQMTELQAVVGNVLTNTMYTRIAERAALAAAYEPYWIPANLQPIPVYGRSNFYKLTVLLKSGSTFEQKQELKAKLATRQIELGSSLYDFVTPHLDVWQGRFADQSFPACVEYTNRHICVPMHNHLTTQDVFQVGEALVEFCG